MGANSRWRLLATLEEGESKLHHARNDERRADQNHDKNEREDNRNWHPQRGMATSLLHLALTPITCRPKSLPVLLGHLRHGLHRFVQPVGHLQPSLLRWPSGSSFRHDALGIGRAQFSRNAVLIGKPPTHLSRHKMDRAAAPSASTTAQQKRGLSVVPSPIPRRKVIKPSPLARRSRHGNCQSPHSEAAQDSPHRP